MSLHDVDKTNHDRSSPQPNTHDLSYLSTAPILDTPRVAHQTASTTYKTDPSTNRVQQQNQRILAVDSSNVPVASFGLQQDGTMGLRVANPGIDVTTNSDLSKLIFNSSQDVFKIVASGTVTLTLNTTYTSKNTPGATVSIAHGLSAIPALIAYFGMNNNNFPGVITGTQYSLPYVTFGGSYRFGYSIDSTNVNFHYYNDSGLTADFSSTSCTATFKYYILQETAT